MGHMTLLLHPMKVTQSRQKHYQMKKKILIKNLSKVYKNMTVCNIVGEIIKIINLVI